jgi:hypothetical protein
MCLLLKFSVIFLSLTVSVLLSLYHTLNQIVVVSKTKVDAKAPAKQGPMDKFARVTLDQKAMKWVVLDNQSLIAVEKSSFRDMIKPLSERAGAPPTREKVVALIAKTALAARETVKKMASNQDLAVTADAWTSKANMAAFGMTLQYLDENFNVVRFGLECSPFPGSHTGEAIVEKMDELFKRNGLEGRVVAAVVDGAANAQKAGRQAWSRGGAEAYETFTCFDHNLQRSILKLINHPGLKKVFNAGINWRS